ncbi:hypothetical protein [Methanobacterium sp.]|uniref:hypothetical protein n=1 Tax=Methanobacterium sp. TaxID=2164 RepID=UPI003C778115
MVLEYANCQKFYEFLTRQTFNVCQLRHMPVYYDNQAPRREVVFVIYAYGASLLV